MRRLLASALILALCGGCGGDLLGPVATCDGTWSGTENGYNLNLAMAQSDSTVTGTASITGAFGFASGSISGTCVNPNVNLTITVSGFPDVMYSGTLSATSATIDGRLNGSGFSDLAISVQKK